VTNQTVTPRVFELFETLSKNNNKTWFDEHRDEIHETAVVPLTRVLETASKKLSSTELPLSGGSKTLFRINRDIRFAKDKSPYKTQVSGLLTPDGTKLGDEGVAYLQLDQRGGHMSAGYYNLTPDVLKRFRDNIVERPDEFQSVLRHLSKSNLELTPEMALTAMPRGYTQYADEWFAEYLKFKVFLVRTRLSPEVWLEGKIVAALVKQTLTCAPLIKFGQSK
jgi:uncharacterized protein (TIGR02453 family)